MQVTAVTTGDGMPTMQCTPGTDTEGCCWWGRGAIQTTGRHNVGLLQRDMLPGMVGFEDVNLCENPEAMCQHDELKIIGATHFWSTNLQTDPCYFPSLYAYVEDFNMAAAYTGTVGENTQCTRFAQGIGGSVNQGNWNAWPHENQSRIEIFERLMDPVSSALNAFTLGESFVEAPGCTGNPEVDFILNEVDMPNLSGINGGDIWADFVGPDAESVYTWEGFCVAIRLMEEL